MYCIEVDMACLIIGIILCLAGIVSIVFVGLSHYVVSGQWGLIPGIILIVAGVVLIVVSLV